MNDTLFDKALVKVKLLSTIFRTNESRYLSPAYQEAEVRKNRQICPAKLQQSRIDRLVYDLYGLTEEEIKIVEESMNR